MHSVKIFWCQFWMQTLCQWPDRTCCLRGWLGRTSPGDEGWRFGGPWPFNSLLLPYKLPSSPFKPPYSLSSPLLFPCKLLCSPLQPSKPQQLHPLNWGQRIGRSKLTKLLAASRNSPKDVSCLFLTFLPHFHLELSPVLSLFTIVSFKNDACTSTAGTNGTCYSSNDCSSLGGTASGSCASGFGVCCLCK